MRRKLIKFFVNNWLTILLAFVPPILITYYFQRDVRNLDVVLRSNTPVVQIEERYAADITVLYQTNKIEALNVLEISVKNSGSRPLESEDFKKPLTFVFNGNVLPNPKPLGASPTSLKPELKQSSPNTLELQPLLLNRGDNFSFLVYLIDSADPTAPLNITARISGIKEPKYRVEAEYPSQIKSKTDLLALISALIGIIVSIASFIFLGKRFKEVTLEFSPSGNLGIKLRPEAKESEVQRLAREFNIGGQDYKANLLLLRIKIEEQLRELANRVDFPSHVKLRSPSSLTKRLAERGLIPGSIASGKADVLPVINRELHATDAYLAKDEFENLQKFTVQLVAELIQLNVNYETSSEQDGSGNPDKPDPRP